jgi:hypothetical protein
VLLKKICHTFSVERFSGNFDEKAETCLIFSLKYTDFKNVIFEKKSLSHF